MCTLLLGVTIELLKYTKLSFGHPARVRFALWSRADWRNRLISWHSRLMWLLTPREFLPAFLCGWSRGTDRSMSFTVLNHARFIFLKLTIDFSFELRRTSPVRSQQFTKPDVLSVI